MFTSIPHSLFRRFRTSPGSRASAAVLLVLLGAGPHLRAQVLPPVTESVVVSASLAPETEPAVPASVTVISREEIERSGETSLVELLRSVPGVDVVESGGPGKVASVFLRGTNSTQTLVLIDGVKVNSPYFSGYDFSALSTQNVQRIEIIRGPFSALYGSDAIGGVISIFTRTPAREPSGQASVSFGNKSFHQETLFATAGAGDLAFSLSGRDVRDGGDEQSIGGAPVDNDGWRDREGSAQLRWTASDSLALGLHFGRIFARSEIPSDGENPTPRRFTDFAQTEWAVPIRWEISGANVLAGSLSDVELHPTSSDLGDPSGFSQSDTRARTLAARATDSWTISEAQTVSAAASYERSRVDSRGAFGPVISGSRAAQWGVAAEDRATLLDGRLVAVAGVRYDRHSAYGSATSPRVSVVWSFDAADSIRASYGTAFRAPSIGELYYPFYGNPDLGPERSRSFEVGIQRRTRAATFDAAVFRNDIRDLIQYDFTRQTNANIGRARTEGVELSAETSPVPGIHLRLAYTYLRAVDETNGEPLVRRPRHRASASLAWDPGRWRTSTEILFVGRRPDVEAAYPYGATEDPSYTRIDIFASYRLGLVSPFVRIENLTDRRYAEASGFPAPHRRFAAGVAAEF
jgi:vitamin B12 transporter